MFISLALPNFTRSVYILNVIVIIDNIYGNEIGVSVTVGCGIGVGEKGVQPL